MHVRRRFNRPAFTLVEILIVVVILGILAAIVVPQFTNATQQAQERAAMDQLNKVRSAVAVYYLREGGVYPDITAGDGTWGGLMSASYLREPPVNSWVPGPAQKIIILGNAPDNAYQTDHGWIFNAATGDLWAGSFDSQDRPIQP